jgi:hypothetical protein
MAMLEIDDVEYLAIGVESGPLSIVNARTGRVREQLRGLKWMVGGPQGLTVRAHRSTLELALGDGSSVRVSQAPGLAAAFSPDGLLIGEGNALRAFTLRGGASWTCGLGRGTHALKLAWSRQQACWVALTYQYAKGTPTCIERLSA